MNTYESIFILRSTLNDEDVLKIVNKLEGIVKQGVDLVGRRIMKKKRLAYEVMKEKKGIYVLLRFSGKGDLIIELERNYRIDDNVIKFLTVKLDKKGLEMLKKKEMASQAAQSEATKEVESEGSTE